MSCPHTHFFHSDVGEQAVKYAKADANVNFILTEPHWLKGSIQNMREARLATQAVSATTDQTRQDIKKGIYFNYM